MMKNILTLITLSLTFSLFSATPTWNEAEQLTHWHEMKLPLFNALQKAGGNSSELVKLIKSFDSKPEKRAAVFLVSFMPERDLMKLSADFLAENIKLAFKVRNEFSWCKELSEQTFFNDILPYAVLNERRDNWRKDFYQKFAPIVAKCKTVEEAAKAVNRDVMKILKVKYSTKRKKADQSPYESMESGLASCSGLSILLTNAFRSVGIPSRVAGTPSWVNKRGNHTWNEVLIDGNWMITEYYMDEKGFDHGWLLADVAYADETKWQHKIYASSFSPTEFWYPLVWDYNIRFVHGVDRTAYYVKLGQAVLKQNKNSQSVAFVVINKSGERIATAVEILLNEKRIASGKTKGSLDDMNNMLQFPLEVGKEYVISYQQARKKFNVVKGDKVQVVQIIL